MSPFKHILVSTDFSASAERAVDLAVAMASRYDAALTLLHVFDVPVFAYEGMLTTPVDMISPLRTAVESSMARALAAVRAKVPGATSRMRMGYPSDEIVRAVEETHADLVVIGTHGRRGLSHMLLGSVAEKVVRLSPVPVLTVRGTA